jgi:hypothetical protein
MIAKCQDNYKQASTEGREGGERSIAYHVVYHNRLFLQLTRLCNQNKEEEEVKTHIRHNKALFYYMIRYLLPTILSVV